MRKCVNILSYCGARRLRTEAELLKRLFALVLVVTSAQFGAIAVAQDYPSRPITVVVPYPAGGPTDLVGRVIADRIKTTLGQAVIVENVPGASGTIGSARVVRAAPDGYTLVVGQWSSHVGAGATLSLQYDPVNDSEPVALLTSSPLWIVSRKNLPPGDLKGLIAWLKANPEKATAGTVGIGSGTHMCLIYFQNMTGTRFQVVPYRGGPPMMQDLLSGQIDFTCPEASQNLSQYRSGAIKVFGVMSDKRWFAVPEIPTLAEGGTPGMNFPFWNGLWAPKGTPKSIVDKLNAAVVEAFADPAVQKRFSELGYDIPPREQLTPAALGRYHREEVAKWHPIFKAANVKAD
jgi:tripartite-type tricarboxylate transporter receptor subunit TctC